MVIFKQVLMITIITGTNRRDSEALHFAKHYKKVIESKSSDEVNLISLEDLPSDIFHPDMYEKSGQAAAIVHLQDEKMLPAGKFIFVVPEYNGSFPGALKLFLDAVSVREYAKTFKGKKAALVGVATGRAGNLRGLEHLTGILNHVGTIILPNRLPISSIEKLMNEKGEITDGPTLKVIEKHVDEFLLF